MRTYFLLIASVAGIACYFVGSSLQRRQESGNTSKTNKTPPRLILQHGIAVVIIIIAALIGERLCALSHATKPFIVDAIGDKSGSSCQLRNLATVANHVGNVAVIRDVNCPGLLAQGEYYYAVFVHKNGAANSAANLVFQYAPGFTHYRVSPPPAIVWQGPFALRIIASGILENILIQKYRIGDVKVSYHLGCVWPSSSSNNSLPKC
jgi:hypothetical protein